MNTNAALLDTRLSWAMDEAFLYFGRAGYTNTELWVAYFSADNARRNGDRDIESEERVLALLSELLTVEGTYIEALWRWAERTGYFPARPAADVLPGPSTDADT